MKIRIKGNSVRFRLTRNEVKKLKTEGFCEEKTEFMNEVFIYRLEAADVPSLQSDFSEKTVTIKMPVNDSKEWFDIDQTGYQHEQTNANGSILTVLIEKDFVCLDETTEDQSDNYPHPLESTLK